MANAWVYLSLYNDSTPLEWTPVGGGGSHAANLAGGGQSSYVTCTSAAMPAEDRYTLSALPYDAEYILQVDLFYEAKYTGAATTVLLTPKVTVGVNSSVLTPDEILTASFVTYTREDITCPDGDIWTPTKVRLMQPGLYVDTLLSGRAVQVATMGVNVWFSYPDSLAHSGGGLTTTSTSSSRGPASPPSGRTLHRIYLTDPYEHLSLIDPATGRMKKK